VIHPQVPLRIPCDNLTFFVILKLVSCEPRLNITQMV